MSSGCTCGAGWQQLVTCGPICNRPSLPPHRIRGLLPGGSENQCRRSCRLARPRSVRRRAEPSIKFERTPAHHPPRSRLRSARVLRRLIRWQSRVVVFAVPVRHPLPNIAGHVVEPPSVRRVRPHRRSAVPFAPAVVRILGRDCSPHGYLSLSLPPRAAYSHSASVGSLPPAHAQYALASSQFHTNDWVILLAPFGIETGGGRHFEVRSFADEPLVSCGGHRCLAEPEAFCDAYPVAWLLVLAGFGISGRCAQRDLPPGGIQT